mmetsp:Transcript_98499/g.317587  ORF Transcript_98499/g.317587 Transcript_98499/m.317587 type:complete len:144 (-) Transcript_98499:41-472(-)
MAALSARAAQLAYSVLGVIVSAAFLLQSIWIFKDPHVQTFWKFCHWIGEGLLCVLAGMGGIYVELKGSAPHVASRAGLFAMNRALLSVYYFWLGCYVMGLGSEGTGQAILAHATGVLSWFASAGSLAVSCMRHARLLVRSSAV